MSNGLKRVLAFALIPMVALITTGCGDTKPKEDPKKAAKKEEKKVGHHHGNNGGHVYQVGSSDFWYEAAYDSAGETATLYFVKPDRKTPKLLPLKKVTYKLANGSSTWDLEAIEAKDGKAYKFQLADKALVKALMIGGGEVVLMDGDKEVKGSKPADPSH